VIGDSVPAFPETEKNINKERRPSHKERAHEPMAELDNVVDLKTMLGSIGRHADELVD
jgi:hypothetical protein